MKNGMYTMMTAVLTAFLAGCGPHPRISILGDSYSTFAGWIPEGHATYYPNPAGDVERVEDCWWHLVIEELHGRLEKNESWSGSTVCHTGYDGADTRGWSFVSRTGLLGNPDLILVCGATNDNWAGSPLGEFKWEDWTEQELFSFRPAMAKMLADLKRLYPKARIAFILNSELKEEINDSVHRICAHYEVPCIDLEQIDKQNNHPSTRGMKAIAGQVVQAFKGEVK